MVVLGNKCDIRLWFKMWHRKIDKETEQWRDASIAFFKKKIKFRTIKINLTWIFAKCSGMQKNGCFLSVQVREETSSKYGKNWVPKNIQKITIQNRGHKSKRENI